MTDAAIAVDAPASTPERQGAINWDSVPRRIVTLYIPLGVFILVLLYPFYWMAITTFKPNNQPPDYKEHNPFWITSPTLQNVKKLLFETDYPHVILTTMGIAAAAMGMPLFCGLLGA